MKKKPTAWAPVAELHWITLTQGLMAGVESWYRENYQVLHVFVVYCCKINLGNVCVMWTDPILTWLPLLVSRVSAHVRQDKKTS